MLVVIYKNTKREPERERASIQARNDAAEDQGLSDSTKESKYNNDRVFGLFFYSCLFVKLTLARASSAQALNTTE